MGLQVVLHHEVQSSLIAGQREQLVPTGPTPTPPRLFLLLPRATYSIQTAMEVGGAITAPVFQLGKLRQKALVNCLRHVVEENEPGLNPEPLPKTIQKAASV